MTIKILFVSYEFPPLGGGGGNAVGQIFRKWAGRDDLQIDLVTSAPDNRVAVETFAQNIRIFKVNVAKKNIHYWTHAEIVRFLLAGRATVARLIRENDYDLAHAFFGFPSGALIYETRKKIPYIVSLRGSDVPGFNPRFRFQYVFLRPIFRAIWRRAERVIANSTGLSALARRTLDIGFDVIPNGIDCGEFHPAAARPDGVFTILAVGRLIRRKGYDHLLRAVAPIAGDWRLVVVGKGDREEALKALAARLGIAGRVEFRNYVPHEKLPEVYRAADVFVQASFFEGMSNTVLEAMASGLPVVVTETGGTRELFCGNGSVVEFGNVAQIRAAIVGIMNDGAARTEMGRLSRAAACRMDWQHVADRYLECYREIADRAR